MRGVAPAARYPGSAPGKEVEVSLGQGGRDVVTAGADGLKREAVQGPRLAVPVFAELGVQVVGQPNFTAVPEALTISMLLPTDS
jgi:hypothetical protein